MNKIDYKKIPMLKWAKDLFPICRSITGVGTLKTLLYFKNINPEFKIIKFKTGQKVFDWVIPEEWNINDAYIQHQSGKKFACFKKNNLHVVNYSVPVDKKLKKKELLNHIYTIKKKPKLIPYVTSYYEKKWGFCITENEKKLLPSGNYRVYIDSSLTKGSLNMAELIIKGESKKEIFFSSYVCHPSMANNELSGPVLLNAIIKYIKTFKKTKYSYRFILLPETIGSIAYLSKNLKSLKKNVYAGFNLSCVGDSRSYSIISSRNGNTIADQALGAALNFKKDLKKFSFLERGSDERQYCAPGVDLPVVGFCRTKYGDFPEYHTSDDNFKVVTSKGLEGSFDVMKNIIDSFEFGINPTYKILCEPFMQKKNLYPVFTKEDALKKIELRKATMDILFYSDGHYNIFEICKIINRPLIEVLENLKILRDNKLIK